MSNQQPNRLDTWYLKMELEDANSAIEHEEDFADGGPSPDEIKAMIVEILDWRAGKITNYQEDNSKCPDHPDYDGKNEPALDESMQGAYACNECVRIWYFNKEYR